MQRAEKLKYDVSKDVTKRGYDYLDAKLKEKRPTNEGWWPSYTAWQAFAVKVLAEVAQEALVANDLTSSAIDWLIPHQANIRIMEATAKKLHVPAEKMVSTVERHANTSAASIPLALDLAVRDGRIRSGQHVMLLGVGGGFTWGSVLLRW